MSASAAVPAAARAVIGGSGSLAAEFPGDLRPDARVPMRKRAPTPALASTQVEALASQGASSWLPIQP